MSVAAPVDRFTEKQARIVPDRERRERRSVAGDIEADVSVRREAHVAHRRQMRRLPVPECPTENRQHWRRWQIMWSWLLVPKLLAICGADDQWAPGIQRALNGHYAVVGINHKLSRAVSVTRMRVSFVGLKLKPKFPPEPAVRVNVVPTGRNSPSSQVQGADVRRRAGHAEAKHLTRRRAEVKFLLRSVRRNSGRRSKSGTRCFRALTAVEELEGQPIQELPPSWRASFGLPTLAEGRAGGAAA